MLYSFSGLSRRSSARRLVKPHALLRLSDPGLDFLAWKAWSSCFASIESRFNSCSFSTAQSWTSFVGQCWSFTALDDVFSPDIIA